MKEKSYMIAVPQKEESLNDIEGFVTRMSNTPGINLAAHHFEKSLNLTLEMDESQYKVEIFPIDFEVPPFRVQHLFPDIDVEAVEKAHAGLAVIMEFGDNPLVSYHAQLKIIAALLPDVVAVLDDSSEKILSGRWVRLAAASDVPPAPRYIYTVQAVSGEEDCVWLHSHGLNRCGHPEIEVLNSRESTCQNHYRILETMANRLLERKEPLQIGEPFFVARVSEQIPLVVTLIDWKEAISHYPEDMLGGQADREDSHNENTCGLFVYPSQEDVEKHQYAPLSIYDELLEKNPIYMISTQETERMKKLAAERLPYMLKAAQNPENTILVKIGLDIDEEFREEQNHYEHIWFELLETSEKNATCRLTQEPYYVKDMHAGSIGTYPFDRITDWLIDTRERRLTPDDVYLMESERF